MGQKWSVMMTRMFNKPHMNVLMLGLDSAGKTTMLHKLKTGETISTIPTIGFNVDTIKYKNIKFTVWDVGGQGKIRSLWRHYYSNAEALVFVVDSTDRDRIEETEQELQRLLNENNLRNTVLLILANKQDLPSAMAPSEIADQLGLCRMIGKKWHIQSTSAIDGTGLREAMKWLSKAISSE